MADNKNVLSSSSDAWKDLASKVPNSSNSPPSLTTQRMVERMNEISPFSTAQGIFDNGCGWGSNITYILDTFGADLPESAQLLAADYSPHMLERLEQTRQMKLSDGHQLWAKLKVQQLDAHDMAAITDGLMSHVVGGHLYFLLDDPRKALVETHRILRIGGTLALSSGSRSQHLDAIQEAVEVVRPGTHLRMIKRAWGTEGGVKVELEATGFCEVETFQVEAEMKYEKHQDFAEMLLLMPVMKNVTEDYSEVEKQQLLKALVEKLRAANSAEPGTLSGASTVAIARKR